MSKKSNFSIVDGKIKKYYGKQTKKRIVIPSNVTEIDNEIFSDNLYLKNIKLPNGLEKIGTETFWNCTALSKVNIPTTVNYIGKSAFWNCYNLRKIKISDQVTEILPYTFCFCTLLSKISFPKALEKIGERAFENCRGISGILDLSNTNIKEIGKYAFKGCIFLHCVILPSYARYYSNSFEKTTTIIQK